MDTPDATAGPARPSGWGAAATLLGVVVVALVAVLIHRAVAGPTTTATAPTTTGTSAVSTVAGASRGAPPPSATGADTAGTAPEGARPAGCTTSGADQTVPTDTPAGVEWSLLNGYAVPTSATDGPALRTPAGVGYCYADTPLGSVLALSNLGQGTGTRTELNTDGLAHSISTNTYRGELETAATAPQSETAPTGQQLAGFRVISYSRSAATVALVVRSGGSTGPLAQVTVALVWDEGDWRAVPQPGASIVATSGPLSSLSGFVPWAGVA